MIITWCSRNIPPNNVENWQLMNRIVDASILLKSSLMIYDVTYTDVIFSHPMVASWPVEVQLIGGASSKAWTRRSISQT